MTVISGRELSARLRNRTSKKALVVSPLFEPDEQVRLDQASIDIRLGFSFALVTPSTSEVVDELTFGSTNELRNNLSGLYREVYVPLGEKIIIHPHQLILASMLEYLRLPHDLGAYVVGRSSWGRLGLIVATAVGIQPGFAGTLTLELRNLGETPLSLYPGQTIAQLFFHRVKPTNKKQAVGEYSGAVKLLPTKLSSELTRKVIQYIRSNAKRW